MKLRRETKMLKDKALASFRRSAEAFNSFDNVGRATSVLLHCQHAFEMLLKAALVQNGVKVFDKRDGRAIGFERCVNLARQNLKLTESEAGVARAIDALRDDEQHWLSACDEGILYIHLRGAVTLFDDLLQKHFHERLTQHWPNRVLPVSAEPPRDIQLLIDEEYAQIKQLLAPGKRRTADARARIRALLAMEAHLVEDVVISRRDVDRVQRAIRKGGSRAQIFPRLSQLGTVIDGEGVTVAVRFSKTEGMPVKFVKADESIEAAAVREVDLQRKYYLTKTDLAEKTGLTMPRALALREYLDIDSDPDCRHDFAFGSQVHSQYSDNAYRRMKQSLDNGVLMDEVWESHRPRRRASR